MGSTENISAPWRTRA